MLFKFSTQLVITAAKCPTKPADFSESSLVEQLVSPFWGLFQPKSVIHTRSNYEVHPAESCQANDLDD